MRQPRQSTFEAAFLLFGSAAYFDGVNMNMNEYIIRELTGDPEKLFALLEYSGMGVCCFGETFLHILRGGTGWFLFAHKPGSETYVKKFFGDDYALRRAVGGAEYLCHVDGRLMHSIYTLINAVEVEILAHNHSAAALRCRQIQGGM